MTLSSAREPTAPAPAQVDGAPLLRRLRESQIHATAEPDGSVQFEDVNWKPLPGEGIDQSWDRLVGEHLPDRLAGAAERAITQSSSIPSTVTVGPNGVVLAGGVGVEPIVVTATRAVQSGDVVGRSRNYLVDAPGWRRLHELVHPVLADFLFWPAQRDQNNSQLAADPPQLHLLSERHRVWDPPPTGFWLTDVLLAGVELVEERAHEFPTVVELSAEDSTIWLWPTRMHRAKPVLPMRVYDREVEIDLALEMNSTIPPPLWVAPNSDIRGLMETWALATLAARELLTDGEEDISGPHNAKPTLETTGLLRNSHVTGHRRWLRPNETASLEQMAEAARLGIRLDSGQTWVRPHTRGLSAAGALRYTWNCDSLRMSSRTDTLRRAKQADGR